MILDTPLHLSANQTCKRRVVIALLETVDRQRVYFGTNWCETAVAPGECPRKDMPSGQGYEWCINTCHQPGHAEINALSQAGPDAQGGTMYIMGHSIVCINCQQAMQRAKIKEWVLLS